MRLRLADLHCVFFLPFGDRCFQSLAVLEGRCGVGGIFAGTSPSGQFRHCLAADNLAVKFVFVQRVNLKGVAGQCPEFASADKLGEAQPAHFDIPLVRRIGLLNDTY